MNAAAPSGHKRTRDALAALRADIVSGRFGRDDLLPGERDLAARYALSRTTLRRLLAGLVEEGLLRHRQGVGTFVRAAAAPAPPPPSARPRLRGFAEDMAARDRPVTTRLLACRLALPAPEEAMLLACSPGDAVLRIERLRLWGDLPVAVERATVPSRCLDGAAPGPSLYETLAARGFAPVRALQRVRAASVGDAEAGLLGVAAGSPGMAVHRTAYTAGGLCCEATRSLYPGAFYDEVSEIVVPAPS